MAQNVASGEAELVLQHLREVAVDAAQQAALDPLHEQRAAQAAAERWRAPGAGGRPARARARQLTMASSTKSLTTSRTGTSSRSTSRQFWACGKARADAVEHVQQRGQARSVEALDPVLHRQAAAADQRLRA